MRRAIYGVLIGVLWASAAVARDAGEVAVDTLAKTTASWDGAALPAYPAGQPQVTILRIRIPPGAELPRHYHPVINAAVLVAGQLTVITDRQETKHLKAGEALVEVVGKWHFGRNDGPGPADIVVFYAGTADGPITVGE